MSRNRMYLVLAIIFFPLFPVGFSQTNQNKFSAWKLTHLSGELRTKGVYREYETRHRDFNNYQYNSYLMGGAKLNTSSFILHPNFLILNIDAEYFPEKSRNNYMASPDYADVRTTKKLDARGTFFGQKKLVLSPFIGFHDTFQNREYLTDFRNVSKRWGGSVVYKNKFLPVSANYRQAQSRSHTINSNVFTNVDESAFHAETNKSFFSLDRNVASYLHNEYELQNQLSENGGNLMRFKNIVDDFRLDNNIPLDEKRKYIFNSNFSNINYHGDRKLNYLHAFENISLQLPYRFTLNNSYNFNQSRDSENKSNGNTIQSSLGHKLYLSLNSRIYFEYNKINHTRYKENIFKKGLDINYTKKIPAQGRLTSSYSYFKRHQDTESEPLFLSITNEKYVIKDGDMNLLNRNFVKKESVVVRDSTGTAIYQENVDYYLIERETYLEIVRIPGGQIANNSTVTIDYTVMQARSNNYDMENHSFSANISLFKSKINIFYRFSMQNYFNKNNTENLSLNYFTQNSWGGSLDFGFVSGGVEFDEFNSILLPSRKERYFINFQKSFKNIMLSVNGNTHNIFMINENLRQKYSDLSGKLVVTLFKQTRMNIDLMYRNQSGKEIDLNLVTAKAEINTIVRQLNFSGGVELYQRSYIGSELNFKGAYIILSRRF